MWFLHWWCGNGALRGHGAAPQGARQHPVAAGRQLGAVARTSLARAPGAGPGVRPRALSGMAKPGGRRKLGTGQQCPRDCGKPVASRIFWLLRGPRGLPRCPGPAGANYREGANSCRGARDGAAGSWGLAELALSFLHNLQHSPCATSTAIAPRTGRVHRASVDWHHGSGPAGPGAAPWGRGLCLCPARGVSTPWGCAGDGHHSPALVTVAPGPAGEVPGAGLGGGCGTACPRPMPQPNPRPSPTAPESLDGQRRPSRARRPAAGWGRYLRSRSWPQRSSLAIFPPWSLRSRAGRECGRL